MNRFTPYVPGSPEQQPIAFDSLAALTKLPHVNKAAHRRGFFCFSVDKRGTPSLMAEYDHGSHWEVLGYIEKPDDISLPSFRRPGRAYR